MPSFDWQLNDDQVAAVLTYIRNAWQTAAAPVSADMVGKARDGLRTRSD
jgi:mono/diheme cytochrome c family protein